MPKSRSRRALRVGVVVLVGSLAATGLYFVWRANSWSYQFERGVALMHEKQWPDAERHLTRALDLAGTGPGSAERTCRTLSALTDLCYSTERFPEGESFASRAVKLAQSEGADRGPEFVQMLTAKGNMLLMNGKPGEARQPLDRALEILSKDPMAQHDEFAWLRNTRGWLESVSGDPHAADAEFDRALKEAEAAWTPHGVELVEFLSDLASARTALGDYSGARQLQSRARTLWESQPTRDPTMEAGLLLREASLAQNLAEFRNAEALLAKAFALLNAAPRASKRNLAWGHAIEGGLAWTRGEIAEAERLGRVAVSLDTEVFGRKHPHTAGSITGLSWILVQSGRLTEAEAGCREALETLASSYGREHPEVAWANGVLAESLFVQGKIDEASAAVEECLRVRRKKLGDFHPWTGSTLALAARIHSHGNRPQEASAEAREAIATIEASVGPAHPLMGEAMLAAGEVDLAGGRVEQAIDEFRKSLSVREAVHGPKHPDVAESLEGLSRALQAAGLSDEARPLEERARRIRSK